MICCLQRHVKSSLFNVAVLKEALMATSKVNATWQRKGVVPGGYIAQGKVSRLAVRGCHVMQGSR